MGQQKPQKSNQERDYKAITQRSLCCFLVGRFGIIWDSFWALDAEVSRLKDPSRFYQTPLWIGSLIIGDSFEILAISWRFVGYLSSITEPKIKPKTGL